LVSADDFAYLVDFGIASASSDEKLTQHGTTVGTFKYMAPERFTDSDVTYRADIYALACVLHECLTGSPPYRGDQVSVMSAHLHQAIPRTAMPRAVICQRPPTQRTPHPIRIAPPTSCSEATGGAAGRVRGPAARRFCADATRHGDPHAAPGPRLGRAVGYRVTSWSGRTSTRADRMGSCSCLGRG
jgi:serine/threonine protein kinase